MNRCLHVDNGVPIDLWLFGLHLQPGAERLACLDVAECERARRFRRERDRRRYLVAHCELREHLSRHTGLAAGAIRLIEGPFGKPRLAGALGCHFNLSHSEDWALLGISQATEIGVDIEVLRPVDDMPGLARAHFTDAEFQQVMALAPAFRDEAFLRVWTRKEACLKAIGTGLSIEPASFAVGLGRGPEQLTIEWGQCAARVELCSIETGPHAVAALARRLTDR